MLTIALRKHMERRQYLDKPHSSNVKKLLDPKKKLKGKRRNTRKKGKLKFKDLVKIYDWRFLWLFVKVFHFNILRDEIVEQPEK